mgnify:FL=1
MTPNNEYHQVIKAVVSKDFRFIHIDAGIGDNGLQRIITETTEEEVVGCYLYPVITSIVREEFRDLRDIALTVKIQFV